MYVCRPMYINVYICIFIYVCIYIYIYIYICIINDVLSPLNYALVPRCVSDVLSEWTMALSCI